MRINSDKKKYLVILAGSPRGGEKTWESLYKYVLDYLDADLAICCSNKWNLDISLFSRAKYKWIYEKFEDYEKYYSKHFQGNWKEYFLSGKDTGLYASGLLHFVCKDMIKRNYLDILEQYEYIVYTRFDQFYLDYHPQLENKEILIPSGEDYGGICDRHAIFPSQYAEKYLSICDFIDSPKAMEMIPEYNNCEATYLNQLVSNGLHKHIRRFKRTQFTSTIKGEPTNWRVATYKVYFYKNLMMKYPEEFVTGVKNCLDKYSTIKYFFNEPVITINYFYLALRKKIGAYKRNFRTQ